MEVNTRGVSAALTEQTPSRKGRLQFVQLCCTGTSVQHKVQSCSRIQTQQGHIELEKLASLIGRM